MESSEMKNKRLKEVFQRKIQEFRTMCYVLTGYQLDVTTENQYRLSSVYAEQMDDSLLFKKVCVRERDWFDWLFLHCVCVCVCFWPYASVRAVKHFVSPYLLPLKRFRCTPPCLSKPF